MNLFARILSHGFALVVVALLAIGLIYRGELFPEWQLPEIGHARDSEGTGPQAGDGQTHAVEPAQTIAAGPSTETATAPDQTTTTTIDRGATAARPGDVAPARTAEVTAPAEEPAPPGTGVAGARTPATQETVEAAAPGVAEVQEPPAQTPAGVTEGVAQQENAAAAAPAETTQPQTTATANTALPATTASGEHADEAATSTPAQHAAATTPYRILEAAREAYWLRDYAAAEQKYQELIALEPDNPDGYGELGNMYFSQGDWDKASSSYYEAGTRLVAQGLLDRAQQLVEVIRGLNGSQAGDLEQQIKASQSAAH